MFIRNRAEMHGGAIFALGTNITTTEGGLLTFINNTAQDGGGACSSIVQPH